MTDRRSRISSETTLRDGKSVLRLSVPEGVRTASMVDRVSLPAGSYRLTGKIQVIGPRNEGARNFVSGGVIRWYTSDRFGAEKFSVNWSDVNFSFDVPPMQPSEEIEFVCEIRGGPGEVWFDANSLRLIRTRD